jgi:hypothetical protein
MGTSLNGLTPGATYTGLIKTGDNSAIGGTLKTLSDGAGNDLPIEASTTTINFTNGLQQGGVAVPTAAQLNEKTNKLITINRQNSSYTLVLSDADKLVEMNVASANNLTVPLNSSVAFSTGTQILLAQYGAGQTTIVATSGVTIRSNGGKLKLNAQYSGATLVKIAENEWYLFGDIVA